MYPSQSVQIPQNSEGLTISVSSGTFNMTGLTAVLFFQQQGNPSITFSLNLTVQSGGLTANYTTNNTEGFQPGNFNAQLKVYSGSLLLYSEPSLGNVVIYPVYG